MSIVSCQRRIFKDYDMIQEFRIAMLRLCQAAFRTGQVSDAEHDAIIEWLRGDLRQMSALSPRSSTADRPPQRPADAVLFAALACTNGFAGLLVVIDIRRLGVARRPVGRKSRPVLHEAWLLDAYECCAS